MITKMVEKPVPVREPLTDRQLAIYNFIRNEIAAGKPAPTHREIQAEFDIRSPNGVAVHVKALERKGWIKQNPYAARSIVLVSEPRSEIVTLVPGQDVRIGDVLVRCLSVSDEKVNLEIDFPDTQEFSTDEQS